MRVSTYHRELTRHLDQAGPIADGMSTLPGMLHTLIEPAPSRRAVLAGGLAAGAVALTGGLRGAQAQGLDKPVVIELFTSQGCSSCPPADKLLLGIARRPNVIALSLPVDYWDYIGWKDTFGRPEHTARQKGYAKVRGDGKVYTPQAVIDGIYHVVGSDMAAIEGATAGAHGRGGALMTPMKVMPSDDGLTVEIGDAPAGAPREANLVLMRVASLREVQIGRGENSGRKITYANVVRAITAVGSWSGAAKRVAIPAALLKGPDTDGWVMLLQAGTMQRPGTILAAAKSASI